MTKDLSQKEKITTDWLTIFPQLTAFNKSKLYKIVGPIIIGIELITLPHAEEYRPYFVIYSLWKNDLKTCLDNPLLLMEMLSSKGLQFSIPYIKHSYYFGEAIECFKRQIPFSMNGDVSLESLFKLVNAHFNDILVKSNSAQQAKLFELAFHAALYTANQAQVQNVLNQIQNESGKWNMKMFTLWYGDVDTWLDHLRLRADSGNELMDLIELNKKDEKLNSLMGSELVG